MSGGPNTPFRGSGLRVTGFGPAQADPNNPPTSPAQKAYQDFYRGLSMTGNEVMPYAEFQRLYDIFGAGNQGGGGGTTPPVVPPPSDALQGLMAQAADPYGTYGQLGVANPYMNNINQRFGYDPTGLAYGVNLQQTPSWYLPGIAHPDVVYPAIKGGTTSK